MINPFADEEAVELSISGKARRRQILLKAQHAARARQTRRHRFQAMGIAIFAALLASVLPSSWLEMNRRSAPKFMVQQADLIEKTASGEANRQDALITQISTEPGICQRLAVPAQPQTWQMLSDHDLVQDLAEDGKPVGLAYAGGRAVLVFPAETLLGSMPHH